MSAHDICHMNVVFHISVCECVCVCATFRCVHLIFVEFNYPMPQICISFYAHKQQIFLFCFSILWENTENGEFFLKRDSYR